MTFLPSASRGLGLQACTTTPSPPLKPGILHLHGYFRLICYLLYACGLELLQADLPAFPIHPFLQETIVHISLEVSSVLIVRDAG